jgi:hypothetical protein
MQCTVLTGLAAMPPQEAVLEGFFSAMTRIGRSQGVATILKGDFATLGAIA